MPQLVALLVYLASAVVFTAAVSFRSRWAHWSKVVAVGLLYAAIVLVAALELPITRLPFWSRDFALTWTLLVVACATALVCLRPGTVAVRHKETVTREGSLPISGLSSDKIPAATSDGRGTSEHKSPTGPTARPSRWRSKPSLLRVVLAVAAGAGLVALYVYGAQQNLARVNTDPSQRDQNAYIGYAEDFLNEDYSHIAGRNRMPVYPFMLSFALNPSDPREVAFARAKEFSLALSLVLLVMLGVLLARFFSPLEAATLWLITAFTVYIFRAAYVQPELLYYTLTAFLFVLMLRFFRRPGLGAAATIGILAGLTHLTKASILPGLAVFFLVALAWGTALAIREDNTTGGRAKGLGHLAINMAIVAGFFVLTVFPYIKNSWYRYGRPFYNVNSTFYVWYDSWREAELGTKAHGDRNGWPDMPASEIPSFQRYLREHTARQILDRLVEGTSITLREAAGSYGYVKYLLLLGLALAVALCRKPKALVSTFRSHKPEIGFAVLYLSIYMLLFAWYAQIAGGNRLVLGLFLPMLLTLAYGLGFALRGRSIQWRGGRISILAVAYGMILIVVILDTYSVITQRILTTFGGS
jgi:hypothetical protein